MVLIDFKNGRRLSANAVGDGGSEPSAEEVNVIIDRTGIIPGKARTKDEIQ